MSDYIKREDALNAFRRVYMIPGQGTAKEIYAKQIENTYKQIEIAPCADVVEQKHGKWIWDDEGYHCSECFFHAYGNTGEIMSGLYNFCPSCGTAMEDDS